MHDCNADAICALPDFTSGLELDDKMRIVQLTERLKIHKEGWERASAESMHYMQHMLHGTVCVHEVADIWRGVSHDS